MTAGTNGIDTQVAQRWLGEALRVYDALEEQKIENMNACRVIRSRLPTIYESAQNAGLPVRALKLSVKKVLLERKIEGLQEDIEDLPPEDEDDAELYEQLQAALGDFAGTPLGAATLDEAAEKRERAEAKKAARAAAATKAEKPAETSTETDAAQVAANTAAIEAGIKPLPDRESDAEFDDATSNKPSRRAARSAKLDGLH